MTVEQKEYPKMEALLGKVFLELEETTEKIGLIYVPEISQEKPWAGRVISVGEGIYNSEGKFISGKEIRVGSRVLLQRYVGYKVRVKDDPREYLVCEIGEIICEISDDVRISSMNVCEPVEA